MTRGFLAGPLLLVALPPMCSSKDPPIDPANVPGTVEVVSTPEPPPKPTVVSQPVSAFADAGPGPDEKSPLEQAREYHSRGQNWLARLLVEKRALAAEGGRPEAELLLEICMAQSDADCVQQCARKLGRKVSLDGGARAGASAAPSVERPADTPFSKARDLHLKGKDKEARTLLESRVIDGKAPAEETRLLLDICQKQGDKMCVALCKKQLAR
ncbi:MAG TPA: hypothetical protein PK141_23825 [Polyangiaceae bacterium]|nr:hypothetical protein [Polyangiaceae bacterium]